MTSRMSRTGLSTVLLCLMLTASATAGWAQETVPPIQPQISAADTAWVLTSSALVLAMIVPGLALFYGGLVRSKNVLGTIMHSFVILCLISLLWLLVGYSLAFGPDKRGLIGGLEWAGLSSVGMTPHQ